MSLIGSESKKGNTYAKKKAKDRRTQTVTVRITKGQEKKGGGRKEIALNMHQAFLDSLGENPPLFSYRTKAGGRAEVMVYDALKMHRVKYKPEKPDTLFKILKRVDELNEPK